MTFPEKPDVLTNKAPEHQKNALKVHAQEMQSMGKTSINPSKKEYLIAWKELTGTKAIWIQTRLRDIFKIDSIISKDWSEGIVNCKVVINKVNPLTLEEARTINNDIDDNYNVTGRVYSLFSGELVAPIINTNPTKEEKEKISADLLKEILNEFEAARTKSSKKEKLFTIPDDVTESIVRNTISNLNMDIVTLNIISKHKDTTQWLEKVTKIADQIIKTQKDKGFIIKISSLSSPGDEYIRSEIIYMVKAILLNIFDEMDKDKKPIPTDEEVGMQKATWSKSWRDKKAKTYECFFCKKRGMVLKFDNYVELKNHIESVHKLTKDAVSGAWVPITGTPQTKPKEEQVKELEDDLIKSYTKPNETWVYVPIVEVAKLVRNVLKIYFPNQKFSVRKSGGSAINVDWSSGPSEKEVENIIDKYHSTDFDAMTDSTISLNRPWGNSYIFIKRQGD